MIKFSHSVKNDSQTIFQEDTDKPLAKKLDANLRYAFFKTIAKGGKSLIRSCKDLHLSRIICYKSLLPEFVNDEVEQQRFLREARVTAMLQHPNTIPIYELGRNNKGHCFFTMKLVHGYTLREILDYRERYDLSQLIEVIIQVAHALEYSHNLGVVHRDIKPENILVGPFGEVLLLDWGLAKVWPRQGESQALESDNELQQEVDCDDASISITTRGKLQGTIIHMSPEQINKDPDIDARTDIYSLGTVLYEILTGQRAVQGKTIDEMVSKIRNQQAIPPSKISTEFVPELLENITLRCLRIDPSERIQTANELIRLLQEDWSHSLLLKG